MNRRGVVFVPATNEAQLDRLVDLIALTSLEVQDALIDEPRRPSFWRHESASDEGVAVAAALCLYLDTYSM